MLSSLDALAGKISPGSGKNSPSQQVQLQQQQNNTNQSSATHIAEQQLEQQHQQQLSATTVNQLQQSHLSTAREQPQQQQQYLQRFNGNHYNGLDSNCNKLCHINHNSIHPYQKQLPAQQNQQQMQLQQIIPPTQQQQLQTFCQQQQQLQQQQHELFQQQLLQQQQSLLLHPQQSSEETDSQQDFRSCLKENAFGMSDKSSTTNSLPNSPIHTSTPGNNNNNSSINSSNGFNNSPSLLNSSNSNSSTGLVNGNNNSGPPSLCNANGNNNNNTCSANRNVVDNESSCFRMDADVPFGEKEPDPDNIKMFVGQVPKSMDEAQLREMFEEYGSVHSINVLRDKATGISKGCCFVTFYTRRAALKAQDALHNVKTLNGMYHPIQMKPADSENRNERKLFVGMLNKKLNENDVRKLFEVHGAIEECTVLRDQNGQSKGCAFVTFATKHAAISAIKVTLNQNKTMEGCTSPLVVKFADTQKEKEQKKIQQIQANLWNLASNINIPLGQTATTVSTPILANPPQQASPVLGADAITPASLQLLQQLQAVGLQQQLLQGLGAQTNTADTAAATAAAAAAGLLPPMTVQNLAAIAAMTQPSLTSAASNPGSAQLTNTAALLWSDPNPLASAYMSTAAGLPQFGTTTLSTSPLASVALSSAAAAAAGKQIEGPEGCNLFIYHLPQEFTDTDLASTFLPFGNVISAKVFIDKQTNLSKCFGFVSFDNPESAQVAIKAMNGFQVGTKRLKVQLKKPKDASKPY
ncbi:CUGBP Elav-like family member 2 isoform X2 [Anastrepha ludens]|uniref:CUGBP Elav-like family member 2 isoform X2 n=1 Tax=Anastrepha ludens TaxID=28586 RepID=UPI0023AF4E25|nr:CUGBP Elav-like family member 2 isoform X2 [Anastrepha ludens]